MKNKLSRLSVTMLVGLIALGAVLILVNPFYSTTSSAHSLLGSIIPSNHNNPGLSSGQNSTNSGTPVLSQSPTGLSSALSQTPPSGTSGPHYDHHGENHTNYDDSGYADSG
jgi:hypothetical protein